MNKKFVKLGLWSIIDQGSFALANFFLNLLLTIYLSLDDYGTYTTCNSILNLIGMIQIGLLIEPMMVFGGTRYKNQKNEYFNKLIYINFFFSMIFCIIIIISLPFLTGLLLKNQIGLVVILPIILLSYILKKMNYVELEPKISAISGGLYFLLIIFIIFLIMVGFISTGLVAFLFSGIAHSLIVVYLAKKNKLRFNKYNISDIKNIIKEHLLYGKWSLLSNFLYWIPGNIFFFLLPTFYSFSANASLKAYLNLFLPISNFNSAMSNVLLPIFVYNKDSLTHKNNNITIMIVSIAILNILYGILLVISGNEIFVYIYKNKFDYNIYFVVLLCFSPLFTLFINVFYNYFRTKDQVKKIFKANLSSLIFILTIGIYLSYKYYLSGVIISILLSQFITLMLLIRKYQQSLSKA